MSREDKIYMAKLAEQAERYEDMVKHMKDVVAVRLAVDYDRPDKNCQMMTEIY
jgi:14-3-3 protein epsilon